MSDISSDTSMQYQLEGSVYNVYAKKSMYKQGNHPAIQLIHEDGYPFATCTINLPDQLEEGEVAIKNYSENEGMLEFLLQNELVEEPHRYVFSGYTKIPVCRLK